MKKGVLSAQISPEIIEQVRDIVYWTPGLTMNDLIEKSLIIYINIQERERGSKFPPRNGPLHVGKKIEL